jgi:hypothetical protein
MKPFLVLTLLATTLLCDELAAGDQRGKPTPKDDRAGTLEQARQAIEARLTRAALKDVTVTASDDKRLRRVTINLAPLNKSPRDDAFTALSLGGNPRSSTSPPSMRSRSASAPPTR